MKKIIQIILICLLVPLISYTQNITVVNMIPNALSNEDEQDSEPNLTVSPLNPLVIVGSAFTPNPTGTLLTAPIFISQDGGNTWVLNNIVPSFNGMTGDITVGLSRKDSLYLGILTGGMGLQMQILRKSNYLAAATMGNLLTRNNVDQPYANTYTPLGGALRNDDLLYMGHNDFNAAAGQTATIEQSLDATTAAPAGLTAIRLEVRTTAGQDGPPIRTAVHPRGTVYGIFDRFRHYTSFGGGSFLIDTFDVVVVRDDDWGQGATPYADLTDPGDGLAGRIVAADLEVPFNTGAAMGQARIGDRLSIAVDPRDHQTVYIAFTDRPAGVAGNTITIHVRRSTDSGNNWSADLLTMNSAIIPHLAVNTRGEIGFLYQQLTGTAPNQQWETHFRQSDDGGATWSDDTLSQAPSNTPAVTFSPYLGDYAGLTAVGKDFYGVFSANNTPDNANFPSGIAYQRNANFVTNNLRNLANTANVNVSIDPFFFIVQQIPDDQDFYVRDWTDNSTTFDTGLEPSTHPVFYSTSDVWNRRSNAPGGFNANDQPQSQNPQVSTLGNNFAFARVHRKGTGSAETVTLHFLKSEFGTGSNYVNANTTPDPTLAFAAGEQVKTMASGYEWTLVATTSSHTCLAVEINTPNDPVVTPTLLGRAPGWPDTDLSFLYDNNKAQRNMGVYSTPPAPGGSAGSITYYAVLHNAATFKRDMILEYIPSRTFMKHFKRPAFVFSSGTDQKTRVLDKKIIIPGMQPGENRWIGITIPVQGDLEKELASVEFIEVVDNIPVNGFTIGVKQTSDKEAAIENCLLHANNFFRMSKILGFAEAAKESESVVRELVEEKATPGVYKEHIKKHGEVIKKLTHELININRGEDPFQTRKALDQLLRSLDDGDISRTITTHSAFNHKMDAFLTMIDKQKGDIADILQNILWQIDLYKSLKRLKEINGAKELIEKSAQFEKAFYARKISYKDYPKLIQGLMQVYKATTEVTREHRMNLEENIKAMSESFNNLQYLQKAHRDYLLKLENLR